MFCTNELTSRFVCLEMMQFIIYLHLLLSSVSSAKLDTETSGVLSLMHSMKPVISRQSTILPLGHWTAQDYMSLCSMDFSVSSSIETLCTKNAELGTCGCFQFFYLIKNATFCTFYSHMNVE